MNSPTTVKIGDWIEREVYNGYCRWSKVVHVYQENWITVVYLDDQMPVKDDMELSDGRWKFKYQGVSGFKIRNGADSWRNTLKQGPPFQLPVGEAPLVCYPTKGFVWLLPRRERPC
jgi:hypothetical protein